MKNLGEGLQHVYGPGFVAAGHPTVEHVDFIGADFGQARPLRIGSDGSEFPKPPGNVVPTTGEQCDIGREVGLLVPTDLPRALARGRQSRHASSQLYVVGSPESSRPQGLRPLNTGHAFQHLYLSNTSRHHLDA